MHEKSADCAGLLKIRYCNGFWFAQVLFRLGKQKGDAALYHVRRLNLINEIAVGTAIAGHPPHRSVREELPHTAPPLSHDGRDASIATGRVSTLA